MSLKSYLLEPRDLLFFRDARPMDADKRDEEHIAVGHGANWPRPDHLYSAVMHAMIGAADSAASYGKFGGLQVAGPFPEKDGTLYFPRPLDWRRHLVSCEGTDAPLGVTHGFVDCDIADAKKTYPAWITEKEYTAYLNGAFGELSGQELYGVEARIGTTLDAATGASARMGGKRSGQYAAEYLRLASCVRMWAEIETGKEFGDRELPPRFVMGGQGGVVTCAESCAQRRLADIFPAPVVAERGGTILVRWTLLAPALFAQTGWRPGWIAEDGKVMLTVKADNGAKIPFDNVRLYAACTGKPVVFSGWDMRGAAKPTQLAVPAGSCYVFACPDAAEANRFIKALHLGRKSDLGSQGFGIGVCSIYNHKTN